MLQPKLKIGAVFGGKRGNGERRSRQVDALMLGQHAAIDHFAFHVAAPHLRHPQFDQPVGEQNARARPHFLRQPLKRGRDQDGSAGDVARRNGDQRPGLERHGLVVFEPPGAYLGALQILQDADGAVFLLGRAAQAGDVARVLGMGAVGKFSRATSMPSRIISRSMRLGIARGPMVQIILARRMAAAAISADKSPETRSGFPGFKVSLF